MKTLRITFALALVAAVAGAQSAPPDKIVATNSEIMAMVAKAKADRKPDQPTFAQPLLALAPYGANLEYRAAVGPAALRAVQAAPHLAQRRGRDDVQRRRAGTAARTAA